MNSALKCQSLFTYSDFFFKHIFDTVNYPWELLPILKDIIEATVNSELVGFTLLKKGVLVGDNVEIDEGVKIEGNAIIADGCKLRHGAYIRGSVILGKGCVIGNSSEIKNSILMNGVEAPHYNYVGDSILGNKAHLGAGAICSNLRSDKRSVVIKGDNQEINTGLRKLGAILCDGVEIGCGAVLCPGTVIGKNTIVYPLTMARGIYPENSIVKNGNTVSRK